MAKMGRPTIPIDWELVDRFLESQSTQEEIAKWLGLHIDTLNNRCKAERGITFSELSREKKEHGKSSLRREAFKRAMKKSDALLIFTLKNWCGMADKQEQKITTEDASTKRIEELAEQLKLAAKRE